MHTSSAAASYHPLIFINVFLENLDVFVSVLSLLRGLNLVEFFLIRFFLLLETPCFPAFRPASLATSSVSSAPLCRSPSNLLLPFYVRY